MSAEWYPVQLAERLPWHRNFATQATATGGKFGLTADQVTQIRIDEAEIGIVASYVDSVSTFSKAVKSYESIVLEGNMNAEMPTVPTPPEAIVVALNALPGIMDRTLILGGILKASPEFTPEIAQHYGVFGSETPPPGTPSLEIEVLWQSEIRLILTKCGYAVIAIDSRNEAGEWVQIGVAPATDYIDDRRPRVIGQPELREFRAQGIVNDVREGALSAVVSAMTMP